jgi:hypothetical protein
MIDNVELHTGKHGLWMRALYMLLMAIAFHLVWSVLVVVAFVQLIQKMLGEEPNERFKKFGRSLGNYAGQIVCFLSFATDEVPFPFSDWPPA